MAWEGSILETVWRCRYPYRLNIRNIREIESCVESPYPEQAAEGEQKKAELGRPEISDLGLAGPPASPSPWKCPFNSPGLRFLMSKVMEMK